MKMIKKESVTINFILNSFIAFFSMLFPILSFPYVSRILHPEYVGRVSFAESLVTYFLLFSQMGIPTYGTREIAKVRSNRNQLIQLTSQLFLINFSMAICSYFVLILASCLVPRLHEDQWLYLVMGLALFMNAMGMEWLYKGLEEYGVLAKRSFGLKLLSLLSIFLLIHKQEDYLMYGFLYMLAAYGAGILNFRAAYRDLLRGHLHLDKVKSDIKEAYHRHLSHIAVFFAMTCATTIYTHLDTVMVGAMSGNTELGYYNAAVKIKTLLVAITTSLGIVLVPRITNCIMERKAEALRRYIRITFLFTASFSLLSLGFFECFATQSILLLSGQEFMPAVPAMKVIMLTVPLIGFSSLTGLEILVPFHKEKIVLYSEVFGAGIDFAINLMLIPFYGSIGAAVGTVIAELGVLAFQTIYILFKRKDFRLDDNQA